MNQTRNSRQQGFTIIELSLSMAFIAMLLLAIAALTIQISTIYNKGVTIRAVNESGASIMRDIQRTLSSSVPRHVTTVQESGTGGRLCANGVVYAWNYGGHTTSADGYGFYGRNKFSSGSTDVRLVRIAGANSFCQLDEAGLYPLLPTDKAKYTAMLAAGDSTLALHKLTLSESEVIGDDTQRMYRVSFTLGTEEGKYITDNGCQAPDGSVQGANDDSYCAVNTFTFTARAGNKGP